MVNFVFSVNIKVPFTSILLHREASSSFFGIIWHLSVPGLHCGRYDILYQWNM